ncbi:MAG: GNAT family N-acetyltransferase [Bacteroidetes bacterium]|nr:MAG: GNAT family N-acetyltransferase [Bacteroidota bacterium]
MQIRTIAPHETWDIRHRVMWPDKSIGFVKLDEDDAGEHYGLFAGEKRVSIVSVFWQGKEVQFRKFATLHEEQGKGYGTALLREVFAQLEERGCQRIWCNARIEKAPFYEKLGMRRVGAAFLRDGLAYLMMEKSVEL